jgi:hypothetical protein
MTTDTVDKQQGLTDIEKKLAADAQGDAAREMVRYFAAAAAQVNAKMRDPLSQDDFRATESMSRALHTAQDVVKDVWALLHPNKKLPLGD